LFPNANRQLFDVSRDLFALKIVGSNNIEETASLLKQVNDKQTLGFNNVHVTVDLVKHLGTMAGNNEQVPLF